MDISETNPDFWMVAYSRIMIPMQDSPTRKDGDQAVDAVVNKSCSILDIPIPQRVFTQYPFKRFSRSQVDIVI